jgi:hypothetical protein
MAKNTELSRSDRRRGISFLRYAAFAASFISASAVAYGQTARPPRAAGAPPARPGERTGPRGGDVRGFPAKPVIEADLAALDDELAQYIQFRSEVTAAELSRLELLIDLRVLSRWCLAAAVGAQSESDLQVNGYLRGMEALSTARVLAEHFKTLDHPSPAQNAAMAKVHAITFKLAELKAAKQADDVFREVSSHLAAAAGPLPPEVKQIPLMRPPPPQTSGPGPIVPPPPAEVDPVSRAKLLNVTPLLKKQVTALAEASNAARADLASADAKKKDDAAALIAMTGRVLDIADGMSQNVALDPQSRPKLEQQLADGVALYSDPRMRAVGSQRISALNVYAQTLGRLRKLGLKPDIQQRLAPLFAFAADHSESGPKLLSAVENYLAVCGRMDSRAAAAGLGPRESKAVADVLKVCATEREGFLGAAGGISHNSTADPATFARHVDAMSKALDSADLYERIPKALLALNTTYKPKPTGGLDRRVSAAWQTLGDTKATGTARDEANKVLGEVTKLADHAAAIDAAGNVSPDIIRLYTRGNLATFDAKRRDLLSDLVNVLASGKDLDVLRVTRLEQMKNLRASLSETPMLELALRRADALSRWVDWPVEAAELQTVFAAYRQTMATLFDAYTASDLPPAVQWAPVQARYAPLIRLLARLSAYGDFCSALPAGWPGNVGRLASAVDGQPFGTERYVAYCLKLWARYEAGGDSASSGVVADTLAGRLRTR